MSRPAKTPQQHFLEGTTSKAAKALESVYEGGRPKIPGHLSPVARAEFKRACKILLDRGTATPGDFVTLALYAEIYARWIESKKQLGSEYIVTTQTTDNNGKLNTVERPNPLIKVVECAEGRLLSLAKSLGLTPGDRDRVRRTKGKSEREQVDPMVAFMSRPKSDRPVIAFDKEKNREDFESRQRAKKLASESGPATPAVSGNQTSGESGEQS
jgi:P27 family predicted phage terminase small subunit